MILDEDPAMLLKATIGNFNLEPDKQAVGRVREMLGELEGVRARRIGAAEEALQRLARAEATLRAQQAESAAQHSATAHANAILALDTHKFRLAKAAADLEAEGERLAAEVGALRARLAELDAQGLEGDEAARERREADDPDVLKLKVFRCLGVDVETDAKTGQRKAVVRSRHGGAGGGSGSGGAGAGTGRGDVHVVTIDPTMSKSYYANYFWDAL